MNKSTTVSNAGKNFWATADTSAQIVYVFKDTQLFGLVTTWGHTINYGLRLIVGEDMTDQPIIAVAYGKPGMGSVYIDLYKPISYNGTNEIFLWQKEALSLTYSELDTLQI